MGQNQGKTNGEGSYAVVFCEILAEPCVIHSTGNGTNTETLGDNFMFSVNMDEEERLERSGDVPAEIRNQGVYQKALEKGSATVHRTRLMIVGQERVGKTSLMRSLIHASFNSNELSTEGVTTDCTINIISAQSWNCKRGDSTSLNRELMIGLEKEKDKHIDMEPLQPTTTHQLQSSSAASQTQTETQPSGTTVESTSGGKHIPVSRLSKIAEKAMSEGVNTQQNAEQPTLNIWDFAGQDLYYTTHQTFLSSRAIYLVVFNLCQDLDKPVPVQDEGSGGSITYRTTPIQYLDFWMQSMFTYTKENSSKDRLEQKSPPIFIVGTHRNSVGGENLPEKNRKGLVAEIFKRIRHEIHNKPYFRYVVSEFYAVENSLEDNLKIEKLRHHIESIAKKEPYMGERIPLNWLAFDDEKGNISGGKPVMTLKQVKHGFGIEDETELLTMLKFYHDLGHIIYFGGEGGKKSQALRDVVILDPQWLIDAFKKILTVKHPRNQNEHYVQSWDRLQKNGILEDLLIDHMWKDIIEHKKALLDLMDMFDLLCERVDEPRKEEKSSTAPSTATQPSLTNASYYVPSMLRQRTSRSSPLETIEKNSNVFYVDFEEFLPDGLYHRLVVRALRWSQKLGGRKPGLLYDRASFYVDDHHHFALQMVHHSKLACIKVSVMRAGVISPPKHAKPPSADVTCKVKDFVKETLQNLKTMWIKRSNYGIISVKCPNENHKVTHFLQLDECMDKPEVVCRFENAQVVIKTDGIQAMFRQESPEEEASAREPRLDDKTLAAFAKRLGAEEKLPFNDIHLREIAKELGQNWEKLATYLHFTQDDTYTFVTNSQTGVDGAIFDMLTTWKQRFKGGEVEKMKTDG
ncbi:probable serine/threonine-protein kinase roco8 [Patiria miniata]|uniref:non-specific serine/threonine protein kinase n=1 Tax=Patiria miniata TaxID=46514 RepID=A0A914ACB9_PATMI|nr:probable serine/threonine-protein kinase roco8 [Patiria miniata]